jgi:hypothetical protein
MLFCTNHFEYIYRAHAICHHGINGILIAFPHERLRSEVKYDLRPMLIDYFLQKRYIVDISNDLGDFCIEIQRPKKVRGSIWSKSKSNDFGPHLMEPET